MSKVIIFRNIPHSLLDGLKRMQGQFNSAAHAVSILENIPIENMDVKATLILNGTDEEIDSFAQKFIDKFQNFVETKENGYEMNFESINPPR